MKQTVFKSPFLGLAIASVVILGNNLTACSNPAQQQSVLSSTEVVSPAATETGNKQTDHGGMNHGGMNHGDRGSMHHGMELGPADAELDLRFIDSMIPHHEGAVSMAQAVLQHSTRPELRKLAQDIIKAQEKEINQMKQWRTVWYPKAPKQPVAWHAEMGHSMTMFPDQIQALRMDMDLGTADSEFDLRFVNAMIPHHEGAVVMAKDVLKKSQRPEVQKLAKDIITSQQAEIAQMKQWRKTWYSK